jgi:hypothetical protein
MLRAAEAQVDNMRSQTCRTMSRVAALTANGPGYPAARRVNRCHHQVTYRASTDGLPPGTPPATPRDALAACRAGYARFAAKQDAR